MRFVYSYNVVVWVLLKAMWIFLPESINFLRKLHKATISGCPPKFFHRVMHIAPSSGHISWNFNMPFKLILRRFEVVFIILISGVRMLHFLKDWWKFIQIHQYYTINGFNSPNYVILFVIFIDTKCFKGIQEYCRINFTEPGWNHESVLNLSTIECLVHLKCVGNSMLHVQQNLQTNYHADIELTQKCIYGAVLINVTFLFCYWLNVLIESLIV